ncbi:MAG: IS66 family transposase [Lentisphaerota bacterium]
METPTLTRDQCYAIYDRGREETVDFIQSLLPLINSIPAMQEQIKSISAMQHQIVSLSDKVEKLEARNKELESQKNKDSHNSHKPPSSDGFKQVVKNSRVKSGKSTGGQEGHPGTTLTMVNEAEHIVRHTVTRCANCDKDLQHVSVKKLQRRQVFDIPELHIEATEHQAEVKECPCCGDTTSAPFPEGIVKVAQYGLNIKTFANYLNLYQLIPGDRLCQVFEEIFDRTISEGTLHRWFLGLYDNLDETEEIIKAEIQASPVVHADETGMRCNSHRDWVHVASTEDLTYYAIHPSRGKIAINSIGILKGFTGRLIHDCLGAYFSYQCKHSICNAHILRELKFSHEEEKQIFAKKMHKLLTRIHNTVCRARDRGSTSISQVTLRAYEKEYDKILALGFRHNTKSVGQPHKRGRVTQTKSYNLLQRLRVRREAVLAFMYDFAIPFTNNLAERDLRMLKVKQKISGTFRSELGAKIFCRVRGYISTARKNGFRIFEAIKSAIKGNPFTPIVHYAEQ